MGLIDLSGQHFGRLTVLHRDGFSYKNGAKWICECSCGKITSVYSVHLRKGMTKSCGCLGKENRIKNRTSHGMTNTRIFHIWQHIHAKCENPNNDKYHYYGNRGICVCSEWKKFEPFYKWAIENGYNDSLTIDRINVNGNYEPNNCRWVDMIVQSNNKRNNHCLTFNGETHTIAEWCRITGLKYATLLKRINDLHWNIEKALTEPVRR